MATVEDATVFRDTLKALKEGTQESPEGAALRFSLELEFVQWCVWRVVSFGVEIIC